MQIVCTSQGRPKRAVYTATRGHLACGKHSLFILNAGDYIISGDYWNKQSPEFQAAVFQVKKIKRPTQEQIELAEKEYLRANFVFALRRNRVEAKEIFASEIEKYNISTTWWELEKLPPEVVDNMFLVAQEKGLLETIKEDFIKRRTWPEMFDFFNGLFNLIELEEIKNPPAYLEAAIKAAEEKATCYHCREPHFIA